MRQTIYIMGLLVFLIHYGCAAPRLNENYVERNTNLSTEDSSQDIIGEWTCYKRYLDYNSEKSGIYMDADFLWLPGNGSLVITADSMWHFDYPREFHTSYLLKKQSDGTIITESNKNNLSFNKLEITGDSLIRTIGNGEHFMWTEYYVRDTLNKEIIQLLLRDSVNASELIGKWKLETHIYSQDGSEPYEIDFPFDLPDSLIFSTEKLPFSNIKGRIIKLDIKGVSREFRFGFKEQDFNYHALWLLPSDWYFDEKLIIHYVYDAD